MKRVDAQEHDHVVTRGHFIVDRAVQPRRRVGKKHCAVSRLGDVQPGESVEGLRRELRAHVVLVVRQEADSQPSGSTKPSPGS